MENKLEQLKLKRKELIKERKKIEYKITDINKKIASFLEEENRKYPINNIIANVSDFY